MAVLWRLRASVTMGQQPPKITSSDDVPLPIHLPPAITFRQIQQKAPSGASALRSHPGGTNAGGSGSAKKRSATEVVSPRADLQFAGGGMVFGEVMDVL